MFTRPYYEPVKDWLRWPGQLAYRVGCSAELWMDGHVIDTSKDETVLPIGPNEDPAIAVMSKQWQMKVELERQLWLRLIARHQGQN